MPALLFIFFGQSPYIFRFGFRGLLEETALREGEMEKEAKERESENEKSRKRTRTTKYMFVSSPLFE